MWWRVLHNTAVIRRYNMRIAPFVLLVRLPIMLPLVAFVWLGERAEEAGNWIGPHLLGFKRR